MGHFEWCKLKKDALKTLHVQIYLLNLAAVETESIIRQSITASTFIPEFSCIQNKSKSFYKNSGRVPTIRKQDLGSSFSFVLMYMKREKTRSNVKSRIIGASSVALSPVLEYEEFSHCYCSLINMIIQSFQ